MLAPFCHSRLGRALGALGTPDKGLEVADPTTLYLDSVRPSLDSADDRRNRTVNVAAPAVRIALHLAHQAGAPWLVADLITAARASGVLHPAHHSQLSVEKKAPGDVDGVTGRAVGLTAGGGAALLAAADLLLAPTPVLQAASGRIGLIAELRSAARRYRVPPSSLRQRALVRMPV